MKNLISKFASVNVGLEINVERCVALGRNLRAKSAYAKPVFNYRFSSVEQMNNWLNKFLENRLAIKAMEEQRKALKKKALEVNPFQVGQLMYDSWGYEQTNIDFYQVIEVKNKSVVIQPIQGKMIPSQGYSSMAGLTAPVKDSFCGEPIRKNVTCWVSNGNPSYYLRSEHGIINQYNKGEEGVYCSWYA
jgi:hypothetical protein